MISMKSNTCRRILLVRFSHSRPLAFSDLDQDLAYETPIDFDLPDYTALGATFRQQVFSAPYDDVEPPKLIAPVFENQVSTTLTLRELGVFAQLSDWSAF